MQYLMTLMMMCADDDVMKGFDVPFRGGSGGDLASSSMGGPLQFFVFVFLLAVAVASELERVLVRASMQKKRVGRPWSVRHEALESSGAVGLMVQSADDDVIACGKLLMMMMTMMM